MSIRLALRDFRWLSRAALLLALALQVTIASAAPAPAADPIVGKWWGKAVGPDETIDFGLEFRSDRGRQAPARNHAAGRELLRHGLSGETYDATATTWRWPSSTSRRRSTAIA